MVHDIDDPTSLLTRVFTAFICRQKSIISRERNISCSDKIHYLITVERSHWQELAYTFAFSACGNSRYTVAFSSVASTSLFSCFRFLSLRFLSKVYAFPSYRSNDARHRWFIAPRFKQSAQLETRIHLPCASHHRKKVRVSGRHHGSYPRTQFTDDRCLIMSTPMRLYSQTRR